MINFEKTNDETLKILHDEIRATLDQLIDSKKRLSKILLEVLDEKMIREGIIFRKSKVKRKENKKDDK